MNPIPHGRRSAWSILFAVVAWATAAGAVTAPMGTLAYLDAAYGFRDVRFDTPFASFHGMQPVRSPNPGQACYIRADEDLRLGDGDADEIRYCFSDERLSAIEIRADGRADAAALLEVFEAAYGAGRPAADHASGRPQLRWTGRSAAASFAELGEGDRALARVWRRAGSPGMPDYADAPPPGIPAAPLPAERGAARLQISAARHARAGQVTTVTLQFRESTPPTRIRLLLPRELALQSAVPMPRVERELLVWDGLSSAAGNLKLKLLVRPEAPAGAVAVLHGEIVDAAGARSESTAQLQVR